MPIKFKPGTGNYKYTAILPNGKEVSFGDKRYQQYKDRTPLKLYSNLDHSNSERRKNYRKRHGALKNTNGIRYVDIKHSPAWFSWRYLW